MRPSTNLPDGGSNFDDGLIIKQKSFEFDVPNVFRVIGTCIPYKGVYYPTLREDKETGGMKPSLNMLRVPIKCEQFGWEYENTILEALKTIDTRIRNLDRPANAKPIDSKFKAGSKYLYPVLDQQKKDCKVYYLDVSWQIHDGIKKLQQEVYDMDANKLAHGPIWVANIVITKKHKKTNQKGGKESYNTMYVVKTASDSNFVGYYPKAILEDKNIEKLNTLFDRSVEQGIFTDDEYRLIDSHDDQEMVDRFRPMSKDEIEQQLHELPIQLDGCDWEGAPYFPNPKLYFEELTKLGLSYQMEKGEYNENQLSPSEPPPAKEEDELKPEMEVKKPQQELKPAKEIPVEDLPDFLKGMED